jgi:hypothetical protein
VTTINMSGLSDEESHRLDYWCHLSTDPPLPSERRPWLLGIQRHCFVDRRNELLYYMISTGHNGHQPQLVTEGAREIMRLRRGRMPRWAVAIVAVALAFGGVAVPVQEVAG